MPSSGTQPLPSLYHRLVMLCSQVAVPHCNLQRAMSKELCQGSRVSISFLSHPGSIDVHLALCAGYFPKIAVFIRSTTPRVALSTTGLFRFTDLVEGMLIHP